MTEGGSRREAGFTMVESVVALALFGLLVATCGTSLAAVLKHSRNNQARAVATGIANRVVDRLHAIPAAQLPNTALPPQQYRVDGLVFTVVATAELVPESGASGTSACDGPTGQLTEKRVSAVVTWPGMGSTRPVRSDTVRRLSVDELDPTVGTATVKVVDRANNPAAGHVMTLNPGGLTYTTAADGCAVFSRLAPGAYTASLSTPGYVDRQGVPAPTRSVSVVANAIQKDPGFEYDRSATLTLGWTDPTYPVPAGTGVTLLAASTPTAFPECSGGATALCAAVLSTGRSVGGLFPSTTGYPAWAGTCQDAQPVGTPTATVLPQGGSAAATVSLARVALQVTTTAAGSTPAPGKTVTITHVVDSACPSGVSGSVTMGAAVSASNVGLPYGTWTFQVGTGPARTVTLSSTVTTVTPVRVGVA